MRVHIEDLKFHTIIGILDFERTTPQEVIINLSLDYKYQDDFINYAHISEHIKIVVPAKVAQLRSMMVPLWHEV